MSKMVIPPDEMFAKKRAIHGSQLPLAKAKGL